MSTRSVTSDTTTHATSALRFADLMDRARQLVRLRDGAQCTDEFDAIERELRAVQWAAYAIWSTATPAERDRLDGSDTAPRRSDGCECGEYGGSAKTCSVHGYVTREVQS